MNDQTFKKNQQYKKLKFEGSKTYANTRKKKYGNDGPFIGPSKAAPKTQNPSPTPPRLRLIKPLPPPSQRHPFHFLSPLPSPPPWRRSSRSPPSPYPTLPPAARSPTLPPSAAVRSGGPGGAWWRPSPRPTRCSPSTPSSGSGSAATTAPRTSARPGRGCSRGTRTNSPSPGSACQTSSSPRSRSAELPTSSPSR
jgi:hypothetical protein